MVLAGILIVFFPLHNEYNAQKIAQKNQKYQHAIISVQLFANQFHHASLERRTDMLKSFTPPIRLAAFDFSLLAERMTEASVAKVIHQHSVIIQGLFIEPGAQKREKELSFLVNQVKGQWKIVSIGRKL